MYYVMDTLYLNFIFQELSNYLLDVCTKSLPCPLKGIRMYIYPILGLS